MQFVQVFLFYVFFWCFYTHKEMHKLHIKEIIHIIVALFAIPIDLHFKISHT